MEIRMLKTERGSSDGKTVRTFLAGHVYFVSDDLADVFVNQLNIAEIVREVQKQEEPKQEKKAKEPENKMMKSHENKKQEKEDKE